MEERINILYSNNHIDFKVVLIKTSIELIDDLEALVNTTSSQSISAIQYLNSVFSTTSSKKSKNEKKSSKKEINYFIEKKESSFNDYDLALSVLTFLDLLKIDAVTLIVGFIYFDRFVKKFQNKIQRDMVKK